MFSSFASLHEQKENACRESFLSVPKTQKIHLNFRPAKDAWADYMIKLLEGSSSRLTSPSVS